MKRLAFSALLALSACGGAVPSSRSIAPTAAAPLVVIDDDYGRALDDANASHHPIVAFACASWIPECAWMRTFVLKDPALLPLAQSFVWLYVDVDKPENAAFVDGFARADPPVVLVLESDAEAPRARVEGRLTAEDVLTLVAPAGHPATPAQKEIAALDALASSGARTACIARAAGEPEPTAARVLEHGLDCANHLPARAVPGDAVRLAKRAEALLRSPHAKLSTMDRSALFQELFTFASRLDDATATTIAQAWAASLADAPDQERSLFDAPRTDALIASGDAPSAIAFLTASEHLNASSAEPPEMLARVYLAMKRFPDAHAAIARALAHAYGAHRVAILSLDADISVIEGDLKTAQRTLKTAVELARTLPLYGSRARMRAALEVRLTRLSGQ